MSFQSNKLNYKQYKKLTAGSRGPPDCLSPASPTAVALSKPTIRGDHAYTKFNQHLIFTNRYTECRTGEKTKHVGMSNSFIPLQPQPIPV
jgi:hypothetical protein